ncbi:SUMF1/EgtB/PvdO family nonheme iron enzyme [Sphingobacterium siyangense]|uniref:SUMF1/EgtB/PvdO family nonheme iron enzyme n=1 Tax=Sphingobacterium siyangense TaxID=459529 RepID=UPI003DA49945
MFQFFLCCFMLMSCQEKLDLAVIDPNSGRGNMAFQIGIINNTKVDDNQKNVTKATLQSSKSNGNMALTPPVSASDFTASFSAGDTIGIFVVPAGQPLTAGNSLIANAKLSFNGTKWMGAVNWPAGTSFDFYAYYPYRAGLTNPASISFSVKKDQTIWSDFQQSDLMFAKAEAINLGATVQLDFKHLLSLVQVELEAGTSKASSPDVDMVVNLTNIICDGHLALASGTFTPLSGQQSSVRMYRVEQPDDTDYETKFTYRALLPAQMLEAGKRSLFLSQSGQSYIQQQKSSLQLLGGTSHRIDVPQLKNLWLAVWIPAGTFQMGSPATDPYADANEKPRHWVKLTKGFYMSRYEVTVAEYADFLNAMNIVGGGLSVHVPLDGNMVLAFSVFQNLVSQPHYIDGKWKALPGSENVPMAVVFFEGAKAYAAWAGGALPTEAQWEYACRAGTEDRWFFGDDPAQINSYAWTNLQGTGLKSAAVGTLKPNRWGLYDTYGNVAEWCLSNGPYPSTATTRETAVVDPSFPDATSTNRFARGGNFNNGLIYARSAAKIQSLVSSSTYLIGFRIIKYR